MTENDSPESTIPDESQFRYVVGLTRTVAEDVAAYYDVVVEVPAGTAEETITAHAAETVADNVAAVTVDDLTVSHHELDAVVLDATYREQVPATLATIEVVERIRYEHDGTQCNGALFHIEASPADPPRLTAHVLAIRIAGSEPVDRTVHTIPLAAIEAQLDDCTK